VSEPDWKQDLDDWVEVHVQGTLGEQIYARHTLQPHIDAAYERGFMAGKSQARYPTRRKQREEPPCAPSAETPSPASNIEGGG
jgi:hypothetical protein